MFLVSCVGEKKTKQNKKKNRNKNKNKSSKQSMSFQPDSVYIILSVVIKKIYTLMLSL